MIKIVNIGDEKEFEAHCRHCGCDFTFQVCDVYFCITVDCPRCNREIDLTHEQKDYAERER